VGLKLATLKCITLCQVLELFLVYVPLNFGMLGNIYLFLFYLMTVAQAIWCQMVEWLMVHDLERMLKEAVAA
jgi:hypothetical protein